MTLAATNKFANKAPAAAKPAAAPKKKASAFGAPTDGVRRDPMLPAGSYRVRVLGAEELVHPVKFTKSYRFKLEIKGDGSDDTYAVLYMQTTAGITEYKQLVMRAAGYASAAEYAEFDADGDFFETVIGEANEFAAKGCTIERRLVDVVVSFGKPVIDKESGEPTGDHYRNYKWTVVADDEQDEAGKVE